MPRLYSYHSQRNNFTSAGALWCPLVPLKRSYDKKLYTSGARIMEGSVQNATAWSELSLPLPIVGTDLKDQHGTAQDALGTENVPQQWRRLQWLASSPTLVNTNSHCYCLHQLFQCLPVAIHHPTLEPRILTENLEHWMIAREIWAYKWRASKDAWRFKRSNTFTQEKQSDLTFWNLCLSKFIAWQSCVEDASSPKTS